MLMQPLSTAMADDHEQVRLDVLHALQLLDTPAEPEFDTIVALAQRSLRCRMAFISLVDGERWWTKAALGLEICEMPRDATFCTHAVAHDSVLVVEDAREDARFAHLSIVVGLPLVRFYAGVPIRAAREIGEMPVPIGVLCAADPDPRVIGADELATLGDLARLVEALIGGRAKALSAAQFAVERECDLIQLRRRHRQFRQAERMANVGSWRMQLADQALEWSAQTFAIHGMPVGSPPSVDRALDFYPAQSRAAINAGIERTLSSHEPFDIEVDFHDAQGRSRRVRSMGDIELEEGRPVALVGVFQDVTDRYEMEQALRRLASLDSLTELANRTAFNEEADLRIAAARRDGQPLSVLLIDLDGFKQVNDRLGHLAGDEVLREIARRLRAPYLAGIAVARLGGDEFVLLVSGRDAASIDELIEQLLRELRLQVLEGAAGLAVSGTIGVCALTPDVVDRSDLLHRADLALYEAKRRRRGSAAFYGSERGITVEA